ncbi:CDP-alcohol phosphatidyltransferase family protein [Acetobacteraceae bacterium H6797]|nr:CDP-alcohol phosphatidyltransferase family protein [Acetobacteraceae bacterium H6797]
MTQTGDRRPIAARNLKASAAIADWLIRREASPNGISIAGMVAGLLAGLAFAATAWTAPPLSNLLWLLGALFVLLRLLANMFDGMVAVGRGITSPVGELYNEVPDRVSDTAVLIGLGIAAGSPAWGMAASLAAVATAYIRAVGKGAGAYSDFSGPMAKQQRMALSIALGVWSGFTPPSWSFWGAWNLALVVLVVITLLSAFTALRRLMRVAAALQQGGRR